MLVRGITYKWPVYRRNASYVLESAASVSISVRRNNVVDGSVTASLTETSEGEYEASVTIPSGWSLSDLVTVVGVFDGEPEPLLVAPISELSASRLSRIDRLPDVAAGTTGGLALHGATGGGSGDAEQETLLKVQEAVESIAVALAGSSPVEPTGTTVFEHLEGIEDLVTNYISSISAATDASATTIVGFPSTLNIGDSYTDDMSADIHIFLRDSNDDPITTVGTHDVTDPDFASELTIAQDGQVGRVKATVTWVTASPEGYLKVEIPSSQSRRAAPGVAQMQLVLKWDGAEKALTKQAVTWVARV